MAHSISIPPSVRPCTILWNAVLGATNFSRRATLSPGCVSVSAQLQQRWNVFNNNGMSLSTYTYSSQSRLISSGQYRLLNAIIARFSHGIAVLIMVVVCGVEVHMHACVRCSSPRSGKRAEWIICAGLDWRRDARGRYKWGNWSGGNSVDYGDMMVRSWIPGRRLWHSSAGRLAFVRGVMQWYALDYDY